MRTYTLIVSIVAHVTAVCAVLFSTVLATDELPEPRRASVFIEVFSTPPPAPPPPVRQVFAGPRVAPPVPLEAPSGVHAEVERPPAFDFSTTPASVIGGLGVDSIGLVADDPPPPPPPTEPAPGALRVGGAIRPPEKLAHVPPTYPAIARAAGVSGVVILEATIAEDGTVRDVRVLRSIPLLNQAAADAVRRWRFSPTLLNGQPVSVLMTVTVSFSLD